MKLYLILLSLLSNFLSKVYIVLTLIYAIKEKLREIDGAFDHNCIIYTFFHFYTTYCLNIFHIALQCCEIHLKYIYIYIYKGQFTIIFFTYLQASRNCTVYKIR